MKYTYSDIYECLHGGKSAAALTAEALSRAENDPLGCIAELDPSALLQAEEIDKSSASLPLRGIPVLVKDNIDVAGLHTTAGSLALADNLAAADAPVVRNLRRSGAVIIGKTNMTEFANFTASGMPGGYSSRGGQVLHAAGKEHDPGGSSTGSAVAVAAGIVPAAVGTDTSFSVIACAQMNGICGLKPPVGTLPHEGIIPLSRTLDSAGAMAQHFSDALALYSAMRGEPLPDLKPTPPEKLRLAVNTANRDVVSDDQLKFVNNTLALLAERGTTTAELDQPYVPCMRTIMEYEFMPQLEDYLRTSNASLKTLREIIEYYEAHPDTMMKYGNDVLRTACYGTVGGLSASPYLEAMETRATMIPQIRAEIEPFDAVIMTGPTSIMHFCGLPSVCVACGTEDERGFRRSVIMYGADEVRLYNAALAVEAAYSSAE